MQKFCSEFFDIMKYIFWQWVHLLPWAGMNIRYMHAYMHVFGVFDVFEVICMHICMYLVCLMYLRLYIWIYVYLQFWNAGNKRKTEKLKMKLGLCRVYAHGKGHLVTLLCAYTRQRGHVAWACAFLCRGGVHTDVFDMRAKRPAHDKGWRWGTRQCRSARQCLVARQCHVSR
jgi:hypothetical protein